MTDKAVTRYWRNQAIRRAYSIAAGAALMALAAWSVWGRVDYNSARLAIPFIPAAALVFGLAAQVLVTPLTLGSDAGVPGGEDWHLWLAVGWLVSLAQPVSGAAVAGAACGWGIVVHYAAKSARARAREADAA